MKVDHAVGNMQLQARQLVDNLMISNDEDISNKISYFLDLIAQKVCYSKNSELYYTNMPH